MHSANYNNSTPSNVYPNKCQHHLNRPQVNDVSCTWVTHIKNNLSLRLQNVQQFRIVQLSFWHDNQIFGKLFLLYNEISIKFKRSTLCEFSKRVSLSIFAVSTWKPQIKKKSDSFLLSLPSFWVAYCILIYIYSQKNSSTFDNLSFLWKCFLFKFLLFFILFRSWKRKKKIFFFIFPFVRGALSGHSAISASINYYGWCWW